MKKAVKNLRSKFFSNSLKISNPLLMLKGCKYASTQLYLWGHFMQINSFSVYDRFVFARFDELKHNK